MKNSHALFFVFLLVLTIPSCEKISKDDSIYGIKYVDLGLSVKWASCNLGASNPWEYGRYFSWGDVAGQTWDGTKWSGSGFSTAPNYEVDANSNLKPEYDAAHIIYGGSWRMPTFEEQRELFTNCTSTWVNNYNGTGVSGRVFTSKMPGYTDKSIFFPAAGGGQNSVLSNLGSYGYFWTSTLALSISACYFIFNLDVIIPFGASNRSLGMSIRPVSK